MGKEKSREEYNEYMRIYMAERFQKRRAAIFEIIGDRCRVCGSTENLEIDHIDADSKAFDIGKRLAGMAWAKVLEELKKCQPLCEDHHKEKTKRDMRARVTHGKLHAALNLRCECDLCAECRVAWNARRREARGSTPLKKALKKATHGTQSMYGYHGCRCDECKEGNRLRQEEYRAKKATK